VYEALCLQNIQNDAQMPCFAEITTLRMKLCSFKCGVRPSTETLFDFNDIRQVGTGR